MTLLEAPNSTKTNPADYLGLPSRWERDDDPEGVTSKNEQSSDELILFLFSLRIMQSETRT